MSRLQKQFLWGSLIILALAIGTGTHAWRDRYELRRTGMLRRATACAALLDVEFHTAPARRAPRMRIARIFSRSPNGLEALRATDPRICCADLVRALPDGRLILLLESKASRVSGHLELGQVYAADYDDNALQSTLRTGIPSVNGPLKTDHGVCIIGFARIGETLPARDLLVLEVSADDWSSVLWLTTLEAAGAVLFALGFPLGTAAVLAHRYRIYRELHEMEIRHQMLIEQLPAVTYIAEPGADGRWLFVSPQIKKLLGYTAEEWATNPQFHRDSFYAEDREAVLRGRIEGGRRAPDVSAGVSAAHARRPDHLVSRRGAIAAGKRR